MITAQKGIKVVQFTFESVMSYPPYPPQFPPFYFPQGFNPQEGFYQNVDTNLPGASAMYSGSPFITQYPPPVNQSKNNAKSRQQSSEAKNEDGKTSKSKWSDAQTTVLVALWKENLEKLESSRNKEVWDDIVQEVNKLKPTKTRQQCKDKIKNMKDVYRKTKDNNSKTGRSPETCPFFEEFDEIYSTRPVMTMPEVIQVGTQNNANQGDNKSTSSSDVDDEVPLSSHFAASSSTDCANNVTPAQKRGETEKPANVGRVKTKRRKANKEELTAFQQQIIDLQGKQQESFLDSERRFQEMMLSLEKEQMKADERARASDQEFMLKFAEIISKKN